MIDIVDVPDLSDAPEELKEFMFSFMNRWHRWSRETFDMWSYNEPLRKLLLDIHYSTNFQLIGYYKKLSNPLFFSNNEILRVVVYNYCKKRMGLDVEPRFGK